MIPRDRVLLARRTARVLCRALLDCMAEPTCGACGVTADRLCAACLRLLERRREPWCPRCGDPLAAADSACRSDHRWLRGIEFARAPFSYAGTGGALVRQLKFRQARGAGSLLASAMADCLRGWARGPGRRAAVIAVPLHPSKRRQRGLDQAAVLARQVAELVGLEVLTDALRRTRRTRPQGDPRVTSRERNVAGAFAVRRRRPVERRTVVLVDDVTTSGATLRECARVLRAAGASRVVALSACMARPGRVG